MEWHLSPPIVHRLFQLRGNPQVDLFASHLNHQLPCWFSQTDHTLAEASNALSQSWTGLSLFALRAIPLLVKTLIKIREDQAEEVIFIAPNWPRRSWYHLLKMAYEIPLLLPHRWDLLSQCLPDKGVLYHTDLLTFQLMEWKLSSVPSRTKGFRMQLSERSSLPPVTPLARRIKADGKALLAGVAKMSESCLYISKTCPGLPPAQV